MGLIAGLILPLFSALPAVSLPLSNEDTRLQYMQIRGQVALSSF